MDDFMESRSGKLMGSVVAVLAAGTLLAYVLPAATWSGEDLFGDSVSESIGLSELATAIQLFNRGWTFDLSRIRVIVALIAAIAFTRDQRDLQRVCITTGCAAGLVFPVYIYSQLEIGASLGFGLILFGIACVAAGALPWLIQGEGDPEAYAPVAGASANYTKQWSARGVAPTAPSPLVRPTLTVFPAQGAPGASVSLLAERFPIGSFVTFFGKTPSGDMKELGGQNASPSGAANLKIVIPADASERYLNVEARAGNRVATSSVIVTPGFTPVVPVAD
jgi:hypothetical protein